MAPLARAASSRLWARRRSYMTGPQNIDPLYSDGVFFPGVGSLQRIVANVSQRVGGTETETEKLPCIRLSMTISKVIRMLPTVKGIGC